MGACGGSTVGPGGVLQGWEAESSHLGNASTPCQPPAGVQRVALPGTGCSAALSACGEQCQPGRDGCGQPRQRWHSAPLWGSEADSVCVSACVCVLCVECVSSGRVMLFRFLPSCAWTRLSRASSRWSWGGTGHRAAVSPSCGSCALGALLGDRAGHWGTHRILHLPNLDSGTDPVAAMSAKLRRWQPHLCAHRPDTTLLGCPCPVQLCTGGLQLGFLQSKQGSRWHSTLAVSQHLMTLPAVNEGVADAGRFPCWWYLSPWWSSAPKSPGR